MTKRSQSARKGFTLLEMMVATTIMAVAIVGLLAGIAGATRNAARLRDYDRVVQLARMRMNELLADESPSGPQGLSGTFDPRLTGGIEAGWQARMTTVEKAPNPGIGQPSLQRIELQIWWMSADRRQTFTMDAHRTHIQRLWD